MPCLNLISSQTKQLCIYFNSEQTLDFWHKTILTKQGFFNDRLTQYKKVKIIGKGGFGVIELATHKLSNVNVAIKTISKALVE